MSTIGHQSHTESRTPKVAGSRRVMRGGRTRTEREVIQALPVPDRYHRPAIHTQSISNIPGTLFQASGTKTTHRLECSAVHRCKDLWIRYTATVSNARPVVPVWEWFSTIQVRAQAGAKTLLRVQSDEVPLRLAAKFSPFEIESYADMMHCDMQWQSATTYRDDMLLI